MSNFRLNKRVARLVRLNDKFTTIDDFSKLEPSTKVKMRYRQKFENIIPEHRKYLTYRWSNEKTDTRMTIAVDSFNQSSEKNEVMFMRKTALLQRRRNVIWNETETALLPEHEATNIEEIPVVFFSDLKNLYAIVFTANESILSDVNRLIGGKNIDSTEFELDTNMFSWLYLQYKTKKQQIENYVIKNLNAFTGTIKKDDSADIITGRSDEIINLQATTLHVAMNYPFNSLGMILQQRGSNDLIHFLLDKNYTLVIDTRKTLISEFPKEWIGLDKESAIYVYVYAYLVSYIKWNFQKHQAEFESDFVELRKNLIQEIRENLVTAEQDL